MRRRSGESYARAVAAGSWQGFTCSLRDPLDGGAVSAALAASRAGLLGESAGLGEAVLTIVGECLEHEAQHHGQLIRYFYANELPFPEAFARRYALR